MTIIGEIDLLEHHGAGRMGRGGPRLLRIVSVALLMVLLIGIGLAAAGAARAPSWNDDLLVDGARLRGVADEGRVSHLTHLELLEMLIGLERTAGVQLDGVDVRRQGPGIRGTSASERSALAHVRLVIDGTDEAALARVRSALDHPAMRPPVIVDYGVQVSGAAVSLNLEVDISSERIQRDPPRGEIVAVLTALVRSAGVVLVSVRMPSTGDGDTVLSLTGTGPVHALGALVGRIEEEISSPARIESITLRRQAAGDATLDVRFSPRDPLTSDEA
jgi:hypothetical protein